MKGLAHSLDRRQLLAGGIALGSSAALASLPSCAAPSQSKSFGSAASKSRRLVLIELTGGNDGLSTVVPFRDDAYHRARRETRLTEREVLRISDDRGLHPVLQRTAERFARGELAIVEGTGYAEPVYSHFRALEIWHTAREGGRCSGDGWIGRLHEGPWGADPCRELVLHVGRDVPYSLRSTSRPPVVFASPDTFFWGASEHVQAAHARAIELGAARARTGALTGADATLATLRQTLRETQAVRPRVLGAAAAYRPRVEYPDEGFAQSLRTVAALMHSDLETRVYSLALNNFDTHSANQEKKQRELYQALDQGLDTFLADLAGTPQGASTLVLCYSEFGRRVEENASGGTDHGAAGPMLVLGEGVRGGLYGAHPSLTDLDESGNLQHTTDFRRVYATVLERWLGADSTLVLPARYEPIDFLTS